jgi:hypothetical protein
MTSASVPSLPVMPVVGSFSTSMTSVSRCTFSIHVILRNVA